MLLLNSDRRFESTNRNPWSEFVYDLHKHREGPTLDQRWHVCSSCWSAIYVLNWGTPLTPRFIWRAMSLYFPIHFYFLYYFTTLLSPQNFIHQTTLPLKLWNMCLSTSAKPDFITHVAKYCTILPNVIQIRGAWTMRSNKFKYYVLTYLLTYRVSAIDTAGWALWNNQPVKTSPSSNS